MNDHSQPSKPLGVFVPSCETSSRRSFLQRAGGGIQPGIGYGATDDLGFEALDKVTYSYELHATALHLLGLDHERLSWYHNGLEQRLTGFEGHGVIRELLV
jgi:hypothetical protein